MTQCLSQVAAAYTHSLQCPPITQEEKKLLLFQSANVRDTDVEKTEPWIKNIRYDNV